tara:strand:+ start:407 stop:685 length:279 start_codon:yes stop_codon:yes gene_type:complete
MADDHRFQWFNAYITARKYTAKMLREKIYEKTGYDIEQEFLEEIIEVMGQTAVEFVRLQNQVFTINVIKEEDYNEPAKKKPGTDDDDEPTQH